MRGALALIAVALLAGCGENDAERAVRATMRDPAAAQFQGVHRCSGDSDVWTGEVNSKNGFGAYTGFKSFLYSDYSVEFAGDARFMEFLDRCYSDTSPKAVTAAASAPTSAAPTQPAATKKAKAAPTPTAPILAMDDDPVDITPTRPEGDQAPAERCWADYCPCDTSNPDYGYLDVSICRDLRMGQPVDDAVFSIGAKGRDARKALREWKAENGGNF